ncbi:MAG: hypothetical protein ACODAB_09970 [Gemmatimonadota bacterium]
MLPSKKRSLPIVDDAGQRLCRGVLRARFSRDQRALLCLRRGGSDPVRMSPRPPAPKALVLGCLLLAAACGADDEAMAPDGNIATDAAEPDPADGGGGIDAGGADGGAPDGGAGAADSGPVDSGAVDSGRAPVAPFFADDFATGDTSRSEGGFSWSRSSFPVSSSFGHGDDHALRFSFGPDASGEDSSAELRFRLGHELQELWIELHIYYPDGTEGIGSARYVHRDDVSSDNNKFIRLWQGDYSGARPKLGASTRPSPEELGDGDSHLHNELNPIGSSMGGHGSGAAPWVTDADPDTCRRGEWARVRMHFRVADVGMDNGVSEWWIDDTQVYSRHDLSSAAASEADNHIDRGYLLGWANSGFAEETHIFIDDVRFFDVDPGW